MKPFVLIFRLILLSHLFVQFSPAQDVEKIRVETDLVTLNVAVKDDKGKPVKGLKREQFEIFDDGVKNKIENFSVSESPATFGIVYDMHPTTADKTTAVLGALRRFTKELPASDDFFMLAFNERGSVNLDIIPSVEQLEGLLQSPGEIKPTSLYDAVYKAADKIRGSGNVKQTLIILSDSANHNSRRSFSELRNRVKNLNVQIYAVIFDENANRSYRDVTGDGKRRNLNLDGATALDRAAMSDLTLNSGGTSQSPSSIESTELYIIHKEIAEELKERYTISFYPTTANAKWHNLRVNLVDVKGRKKLSLNYRQGYQSTQ